MKNTIASIASIPDIYVQQMTHKPFKIPLNSDHIVYDLDDRLQLTDISVSSFHLIRAYFSLVEIFQVQTWKHCKQFFTLIIYTLAFGSSKIGQCLLFSMLEIWQTLTD